MNGVANTLRRLAHGTSVRQCALCSENSSMTTLHRVLRTLHYRPHSYRLIPVHPQRRKTGPQNLSPQVRMLFKIHNPI